MSHRVGLSICITYYNAPEFLRGCLESIWASPPRTPFEVIVVDDASPRPAADVLGVFPSVRLIRLSMNVGFAAASNAATDAASGNYLLLLNCDTQLLPGALDAMVESMTAHPGVAVVGPRLLNADGSFQPQCKRGRLTPLTGLAYSLGLDRLFPNHRLFGEYLMRYAPENIVQDVKAVSGACMMVRRSAIEAVGGLDESFVMYAEDLDWCYRFGEAGWRVVYLPLSNVIHYGGQGGTNFRFWRSLYLYHRALWVLFRRHARGRYFPVYGWVVGLGLALRFLAKATLMLLTGKGRVGTAKGAGNGARAAFLDRDGVINRKPPQGEYVTAWEGFEFLAGVEEAVRLLNEAGFQVIVVTNQRGIALGRTTEERVQEIHRRMIEHLAGAGARIDGVYYCPHDEGTCGCRKPGVGLLLQARKEFPGLDFRRSFVIGDSPVDIEAGRRLGCRTILIAQHPAAVPGGDAVRPDHVAGSLLEAVVRYVVTPEGTGLGRSGVEQMEAQR